MPGHGGHGGHGGGHHAGGRGHIGSHIGSHIGGGHIGMSAHRRYGGGGGGGRGLIVWRSPAQIAFDNAATAAEIALAPPACDVFLMRLGSVLAFATLPLTLALLGASWLKVDSHTGSSVTWDGRTTACAGKGGRRQAGFLNLWEFSDCNAGGAYSWPGCPDDSVRWYSCGDSFDEPTALNDGGGVQPIAASNASDMAKAGAAVAGALLVLTLLSVLALLVRNCQRCGSRFGARNRQDPFFVGFADLTRLQLAAHFVFVATALGVYYGSVPVYLRAVLPAGSFVGTSNGARDLYAAPGQQLGIAHTVLTALALALYSAYSWRAAAWAAAHPVPDDLLKEPPPPTPEERAAGIAAAQAQQGAEVLVMLAAMQGEAAAAAAAAAAAGVPGETQAMRIARLELELAQAKAAPPVPLSVEEMAYGVAEAGRLEVAAPPPPLPLRILLFVTIDATGRTVSIDADTRDSVASVLMKLMALGELPPGEQPRLLLRGQPLDSERGLAEYHIQSETTLHLQAQAPQPAPHNAQAAQAYFDKELGYTVMVASGPTAP